MDINSALSAWLFSLYHTPLFSVQYWLFSCCLVSLWCLIRNHSRFCLTCFFCVDGIFFCGMFSNRSWSNSDREAAPFIRMHKHGFWLRRSCCVSQSAYETSNLPQTLALWRTATQDDKSGWMTAIKNAVMFVSCLHWSPPLAIYFEELAALVLHPETFKSILYTMEWQTRLLCLLDFMFALPHWNLVHLVLQWLNNRKWEITAKDIDLQHHFLCLFSFLRGPDTLPEVCEFLYMCIAGLFVVYTSIWVQSGKWPRIKCFTVAKCTLASHIIVS